MASYQGLVFQIPGRGERVEGREWILPGLLYGDERFLYGELEDDLRAMVGWFVGV